MISAFGIDFFDTAVDKKHGANAAGGHAAVDGGVFDGNTQKGGLADGVLFGVDGADTVIGGVTIFMDGLFHLVTNVVAVVHADGRANIAGDQDVPVANNDAARSATVTSGAGGDGVGHA